MQAYDELVERLAYLPRVSAREKGAATRMRPGERSSAGTETWHRLYSPAQDTPPSDAQALLPPVRPRPASPLVWRLSKTVFGLGIVAVLGLAVLQSPLHTSSVEAVVNARMVTLRAPIDGKVQAGPHALDFGASLERGDVLFRIINSRADRSRVDNLTRRIEQLKDERPGIADRLANARMLLEDLTEQTRLFAEARILQLEARQDELRAELAAAQARNEEAKNSLDRFATLAGKGWLPRAQLNQAQRDGMVAEKLEAAAQKRLEAVGVELAAAQRGVFVGIGNNDRPRYMQRADQLEQQVGNLADTLAERDQRMIRLTDQLAEEKARYAVLAAADMVAPDKGSVWEVLTAPEEQVHRGQDLLRVLDCGGAVVTAVVSEDVYNRLQVGSPARFQPRDGRENLPGRIIRLIGPSASPANFAIQPSAPLRDSYHVTVAVPKLAEGHGCMVGRPGRVFFNDGPREAMAALTPPAL
jgi:multidrug resistance efflux pump